MVVGEGRPYLVALIVLNYMAWEKFASSMSVEDDKIENLGLPKVQKAILKKISSNLKEFPGYAQIRRVKLYLEPWTIENNLLTPTLK